MIDPVDPIPMEARHLQGRPAGLVTRGVAAGIDVGIVVGGLIAIYAACVAGAFLIRPRGFDIPAMPTWLPIVVAYVAMTLYLALAWHGQGRTFGCQLMGIRVIDRRGRGVGLLRSVLRALIYLAFPLGFGWVIVSRRNLTIQDLVVGTSVVYDWDMRPMVRTT